jgi:hypothetical protein
VENSTVKNTCEASTLTDPVLPPTCENKELSSNQDIVKTADKEIEAHPLCSSEGVQCEFECQHCSDKSRIIASVKNFAECMLAINMNTESMNMLLKIIASVPEIDKSSILNHEQPADIDNIVRGPSSRSEINETVSCTKSSTVNKNCPNSLEGQINPLLASESASSPSSKPENVETPTAATKTTKCAGEDVADEKDPVNPAAKDERDESKQIVSCEKQKATEPSPPQETECESKSDMLFSGKISCVNLGETAVNLSALNSTECSQLVIITDNSAQSVKCEKTDADQASPVSQTNIFSDSTSLVKKGITEKEVIVASTNKSKSVLDGFSNQIKITKDSVVPVSIAKSEIASNLNKNPLEVVAPSSQIKICPPLQKTGLVAKGAEKCINQQPQTETQAISCGPVQKAKQVTKTQLGTGAVHRRPGSSGCQQAKTIQKSRPRPAHQAIKKKAHESRQVKVPQWLAEEIRQSNWRNNYHNENTWYNDRRPWSMPLLPTPLPRLLELRGLRPVFWSQEEEDASFGHDAFGNCPPDNEMYDHFPVEHFDNYES